jgi:hypothetical protein
MIFLDVIYTSLATICIMALIQVLLYVGVKIAYPPEPRIIYRDVPTYMAPPPQQTSLPEQPTHEVKIPEYEPREQISGGLRLDPQLPPGLKETRPEGL